MIWASIPNDERLRLWRKLREDIRTLALEDQLKEIARFCGSIPYGSRSLDYYSPDDWPTPWEILYHGSFCTSSISLLMFYTFALLNTESKVDLYLVEDDEDTYLLPVIDDHFVLNYELGKVSTHSELQDCFKVLQVIPQARVKIK